MPEDLDFAMLTQVTRRRLGIKDDDYTRLCEGFGTSYCLDCAYSVFIPDKCEMGEIEETDESILCSNCPQLCPCNRSDEEHYQSAKRNLLRFESKRLGDLV